MKSVERKERLRRLSEMNRRALGVSSFEAPESYTKGRLQPGELILAMWMASASKLLWSVPALSNGIPSPAPIPWSRCSPRSANRCIGGSGKKLLNKSLLALLIHLFILFLQ